MSSPVSFPISFTSNSYSLVCGFNGAGTAVWGEIGITNKTSTGFDCGTRIQSFIAIGY